MTRPNILWIMTDEERFPPAYESESVRRWRHEQLPARQRLIESGTSFERHYTASSACVPSRTTLFTGQLPTLHGNADTDGTAKSAEDPAIHWLEPYTVPTLGDWFRAGGYQTHYRGKWHITHQDIRRPGEHKGLATTDVEGNRLAAVEDCTGGSTRSTDSVSPDGSAANPTEASPATWACGATRCSPNR